MKLASSIRFAPALLALAGACVSGSACAPAKTDAASGAASTATVVVDFYRDGRAVQACSGTLLAKNVVLTAAHCADGSTGALVTTPHSSTPARVERVMRYDWVQGVPHPHVHNDLALLVLRDAVPLASYPKIAPCKGCNVAQMSGSRIGEGRVGPVQPISKTSPASHPLALYTRQGIVDSGGGTYQVGPDGLGHLVGVTIGRGAQTGGGYVARLDDAKVQEWIRFVVQSASPTRAAVTTKSVHALDDTPDPTAGGDPSNGDPFASGADGNPSSGNDDAGSADNGSPNGGNPPDGADAPDAGDPAAPPDTPEATDDQVDFAQEGAPPDNHFCANGGIDCGYTTSQAGLAFLNPQGTRFEGTWQNLGTSNSPTAPNALGYYSSTDGAFEKAPDEASAANAAGFNYFVSHGFRDGIVAPFDGDMATQLLANGRDTLVASCFAGADSSDCIGTDCTNAVNRLAHDGKGDPGHVWGCTSFVGNGPVCDITDGGNGWVNGNHQTMSAATQAQLGVTCCTRPTPSQECSTIVTCPGS